ncbi:hypothetical protein [Chitinophaga sp. RAB17]|uniref:hypothetical protein n=1 Tax=Chitinophaga sp. RAB17 TaxID=3233049 RepID=UPI003F8E5A3B
MSNFAAARNALLSVVNRKILSSKITTVNKDINKKLEIEINAFKSLLDGIEGKFRKCEMLYITYFENIDHAVLSGNPATLPYLMDCTFIDGTATLRQVFECDDRLLYKEIIDMNFQSFILMISSIYECLVTLSEVMLKKVIIHGNKPPQSSPLHDYRTFLKILISLGYRRNDELSTCINGFDAYFDGYLLTIYSLRNSFVHGYNQNLASDTLTYKIIRFESHFAATSPLLNVDVFTKEVLDRSRDFINSLYGTLARASSHYRKSLPA